MVCSCGKSPFSPFKSEIKLLLASGGIKPSIKLENKVFLIIQNIFHSLSYRGCVSPRDRQPQNNSCVWNFYNIKVSMEIWKKITWTAWFSVWKLKLMFCGRVCAVQFCVSAVAVVCMKEPQYHCCWHPCQSYASWSQLLPDILSAGTGKTFLWRTTCHCSAVES